MRILILGGTAWLGGQIAAVAVRGGHDVTCLARGGGGPVPDGVRFVRADRDLPDAYVGLDGDWDLAVDVARQPGQVRRAVAALADRASAFAFISTINVYADTSRPGQDEGAALLPALDGDVMESMADYGPAKVACERHVLGAFGPDRALIARPGLIGGPGDSSDRTGYWPLRFARPAAPDGAVLVPDEPELATQVIDVRDLAEWIVAGAARGVRGVFDTVGPVVPLGEHLAVAREVGGHTGPLVSAASDWLTTHGVEPWMGERSLPLWLPTPAYAGLGAHDDGAARGAGLCARPLAETLCDTLAWELAREPGGGIGPRRAGLADDDERALLAELRE
jgi:2'-hydroxyisoflavone reductase